MTKERSIINTHDQLRAAKAERLPDVAILPRRIQGTNPDGWRNGWKVIRPGCDLGTEKSQWDRDYGCRVFHEEAGATWREQRANALQSAKDWVSVNFGVSIFVRNRMGDYVDARVNKLFPLERSK